MNHSSNAQFGLLVAYLLPGFIALAGVAPVVPIVSAWLRPGSYAEASLGAPVYAILAATTVGMVLSCVRWLVIDHVHHGTGLKPPMWDDTQLDNRLGGFAYLVENHYRYYQFFANTLIAVVFAYAINRWAGTSSLFNIWTDVACLTLCAALFAGSRDALAKYYARTSRLIGNVADNGSFFMTNGNQHEGGSTSSPKSTTGSKQKPKTSGAAPVSASKPDDTPPRK